MEDLSRLKFEGPTTEVALKDLCVSHFVSTNGCPYHKWDMTVVPLLGSAYYCCLQTSDRRFYDYYMDLWEQYEPGAKATYDYEKYFLKLVEEIRADGCYISAKRRNCKGQHTPPYVWARTHLLGDGHHLMAILAALYGPDCKIPVYVIEGESPYPHDVCGRPCRF